MALYRIILFLAMCLLLLSRPYAQTVKRSRGIICLTYDDGLDSHLKIVIPQLDSLDLKGTFFLNSIRGSSEVMGKASAAVQGWKTAASKGHELGNHTLFHPCPEKVGWPKDLAIETYTIEDILNEIQITDALLDLIDNKQESRAFAYPCNNVLVGGRDYSAQLQSTNLVRFARLGGDRNSIIKNTKALDVMHVPSWMVEEGTSLVDLIKFAEKSKEANGMAVYQFHSIDGQLFSISRVTHRKFLEYLKKNEQDYDVTTFSAALGISITR
jgi:peptidoglycan/xylan/chitin deacetylase (PgdA/CDA1 family)